MNIKEHQLESSISYAERGVHGYGRKYKPKAEKPEYFRCGLCCEAIVGIDGQYCEACQKEDDAFFAA